jgi:hypothetical protein
MRPRRAGTTRIKSARFHYPQQGIAIAARREYLFVRLLTTTD